MLLSAPAWTSVGSQHVWTESAHAFHPEDVALAYARAHRCVHRLPSRLPHDIEHDVLTTDTNLFRCNRPREPVPPSFNQRITSTSVAIHPSSTAKHFTYSQDVRPLPLNAYPNATNSSPDPSQQHGLPRPNSFESLLSSLFDSPSHNVPITTSNNIRPRSSTTQHVLQNLAPSLGLPQKLPAPPTTAPSRQQNLFDPLAYLESLQTNYRTMLAQKDSNPVMAPPEDPAATQQNQDQVTMEIQNYVLELLGRFIVLSHTLCLTTFSESPEFKAPPAPLPSPAAEFLTSPLFETPYLTPYDDFNTSPLDDSPFEDYLNTPLIPDDGGDFITSPMDQSLALFPDFSFPNIGADQPIVTQPYFAAPAKLPSQVDVAYPSPQIDAPSPSLSSTSSRRRSAGPTGTRKNITADNLVPMDAPTQPRTYRTPSATSRKEVPMVFQKKRKRAQASPVEVEEDEELADLPPDATEAEQIAHKRRQNTLAARKSRKRKLEHAQLMEDENKTLRERAERLEAHNQAMRQLLLQHGLEAPSFDA